MKTSKKINHKKIMKKNVNNQVNSILKQNMSLNESHIPFASRFLKNLLKEQEEMQAKPAAPAEPVANNISDDKKGPRDFTETENQKDFKNAMDPNTNPEEFDTDGVSPDVTTETIKSIKEWSNKLDEFAEFLNDPSTNSLHKILADGDRAGSLLRGITRKASDSITRIAGEVEKLKEILNTYIITAPKKLRDTESQVAGWTQY
jgi:uncharacterized membrane-anchored protein YjiN (DUF445 family)